jgi:YYY domain-containing protein
MLHILSWWLLIQLLGLAALPLAYRLFKWLPGRGYTFAKPLGLLLTSYLLWLGASLGFLHTTTGGIVAAAALVAGASLWLYTRRDESDPALLDFLRAHGRLILTVEVLFVVAFAAWVALRAYAPDKIMSSGGEKFMEIAFLNAILKSRSFPPHDPWLSGFGISYYYFGYVMMALMSQLSGVVSGVGFELYDALLFALTMTGAFGVVYNLIAGTDDRRSLPYGLLGSLFVAVLSNLEGLMEALYARGILPMRFWRWLDLPDLIEAGRVTGSWYPGHGWWWWRASRVIRDRDLLGRPMGINPIDEFPFFSFLLGDNHPHVLALPFVLMAIALALNLLRWASERTGARADVSWATLRLRDGGRLALYALALGALGFLNTWDFPIYLALTVLAYGLGLHIASNGEKKDAPSALHSPSSVLHSPSSILIRMVVLGIGLLAGGIILYLPFYLGFQSQAGGVLPYLLPPTRLPQYLVMFGPFIFIVAWFLLDRLRARIGGADRRLRSVALAVARWWGLVALLPLLLIAGVVLLALLTQPGQQLIQGVLADPAVQQVVGGGGPLAAARAIILARLRDPWLHLTLSFLIALAVAHLLPRRIVAAREKAAGQERVHTLGDAFAALLMLVGLALTFAVEFVYLRDNFGVRMNTVFKFYYQGWVMLGCASAYAVWRLRSRLEGAGRYAFQIGLVVLVAAGLVYPVMASYSRVHGFQQRPHLNGAINIARDHPDDWAAIEWLRQNAPATAVVLEAPGQSYDYEGRISAFTGLQAVLGWSLHEGQWRGSYVEQGKREPDIQAIYTAKSERRALELLHKWEVDYVIVGPPERRYVERLCGERQCQPASALETLATALQPVFEQGRTTVYRVP